MRLHPLQFLSLLVLAVVVSGQLPASDGEDGTALVIIDMQGHFVQRYGNHRDPDNAEKIVSLTAELISLIERAKTENYPIALVECENCGRTIGPVREAIGDYPLAKTFRKTTNGMFESGSRTSSQIDEFLRHHRIKTLVVTGANGSACVKKSIEGALQEGWNVVALSSGIADFRRTGFHYPYQGRYAFGSGSFREAADMESALPARVASGSEPPSAASMRRPGCGLTRLLSPMRRLLRRLQSCQ